MADVKEYFLAKELLFHWEKKIKQQQQQQNPQKTKNTHTKKPQTPEDLIYIISYLDTVLESFGVATAFFCCPLQLRTACR